MNVSHSIGILLKGTDKASPAILGVTKALGGLSGISLTAAIAGVTAMAAGLAKLAIDAAPIQSIKTNFDALTESITGGSKAVLAALKEASNGMLTNAELMEQWNTAAIAVSKIFAQTLPDALRYMSQIALATGKDLDYMINSYVQGISKLSPKILDNLNVQIDLNKVYKEYADGIGKVVGELSRQEQQMAVSAAVLEQLRAKTAELPGVVENAQVRLEQLRTRIEDIKDSIGLKLLPVLELFLTVVDKLITIIGDNWVPVLTLLLIPALLKLGGIIIPKLFSAIAQLVVTGKAGTILMGSLATGAVSAKISLGALIPSVAGLVSGLGTLKFVAASLLPVLGSIGLVAAAVVVQFIFFRNMLRQVKETLEFFGRAIKNYINLFVDIKLVTEYWGKMLTAVKNKLMELREAMSLKVAASQALREAIARLKEAFATLWDAIKSLIRALTPDFTALLLQIINIVGQLAEFMIGAATAAIKIFTAAIEICTAIVEELTKGIKYLAENISLLADWINFLTGRTAEHSRLMERYGNVLDKTTEQLSDVSSAVGDVTDGAVAMNGVVREQSDLVEALTAKYGELGDAFDSMAARYRRYLGAGGQYFQNGQLVNPNQPPTTYEPRSSRQGAQNNYTVYGGVTVEGVADTESLFNKLRAVMP